jgi:hypothetical protein
LLRRLWTDTFFNKERVSIDRSSIWNKRGDFFFLVKGLMFS